MTQKIIHVDASSLKDSACIKCLYHKVVDGYRGKGGLPNDIVYGSAYHKFVEDLLKSGGNFPQALINALTYYNSEEKHFKERKEWLNEKHLTQTCNDHVYKFGMKHEKDNFIFLLEEDLKPLVEKKFSIPIFEDDEIAILLSGTIDQIGKFQDGCYAFGDIKTTTSWNQQDYFAGYELSVQILTYDFAIRYYAAKYPESVFGKLVKEELGWFINGVFVSSNKPTEFLRSDIKFVNANLRKWYNKLLQNTVSRLLTYVKLSIHDPNIELPKEGILNDACSGAWGNRCLFWNSCKAPDQQSEVAFLENFLVRKPYNPLEFR